MIKHQLLNQHQEAIIDNKFSIFKIEAEKEYIGIINDLIRKEVPEEIQEMQGNYKHLMTSIEYENIYKIVLNRPKKFKNKTNYKN